MKCVVIYIGQLWAFSLQNGTYGYFTLFINKQSNVLVEQRRRKKFALKLFHIKMVSFLAITTGWFISDPPKIPLFPPTIRQISG